MSGRKGSWSIVLGIAAAVLLVLVWQGEGEVPVGRGTPAPDFELNDLEGRPLRLADYRGRVVLINFWATWCKPCEQEMPAFARLHRQLQPDGFELLAISVDSDPAAVREFRERHALPFAVLLDPEQSVAKRYQTFRFPESLLVDRNGVIVERYVGLKDWEAPAYAERIRRLLGPALTSRPARSATPGPRA